MFAKSSRMSGVLILGLAVSGIEAQFTVRMGDRVDLDYRAIVAHVVDAPPFWDISAPRDVGDRTRYRAVVLRTAPVPSLIIEVVAFRNEGCCSRLVAVREVDLFAIAEQLGMDEEPFTFALLKAASPRRFTVRMNDRTLLLELIDSHTVRVTPD